MQKIKYICQKKYNLKKIKAVQLKKNIQKEIQNK